MTGECFYCGSRYNAFRRINNCSCNQAVEDIRHFLFDFPFFANNRGTLSMDFTNILQRENHLEFTTEINLYLYGNSDLTKDANQRILRATIKYVKNTQKFLN